MKARITKHSASPSGTRRMVLEAREVAVAARPGQFVHVLCTPAPGLDPLLRRPLSIHAVDKDSGEVVLLYDVVGRGTALLAERQVGETVDLLGPLGNGFALPTSADQPVFLVGGGIGAAPLYYLADEIARTVGRECMTLIMGAASINDHVCFEEFKGVCGTEAVEEKYCVATDDGSFGHCGFVTDLLVRRLEELGNGVKPLIYACGPTPMLKAVSAITKGYGLKCQVSLEAKMACGVGACMGCVVKVRSGKYVRVCKEGPVFDADEVVWE